MLLTGIALILDVGVLTFSGFAISHQIGLLPAWILAVAIVADLVLLPPLLILFDTSLPKPSHEGAPGQLLARQWQPMVRWWRTTRRTSNGTRNGGGCDEVGQPLIVSDPGRPRFERKVQKGQ